VEREVKKPRAKRALRNALVENDRRQQVASPRLSSRSSIRRRSSMRFEEIRCRFACRTPRLRRSSIDKSRRRPRYEGMVRGFRSLVSVVGVRRLRRSASSGAGVCRRADGWSVRNRERKKADPCADQLVRFCGFSARAVEIGWCRLVASLAFRVGRRSGVVLRCVSRRFVAGSRVVLRGFVARALISLVGVRGTRARFAVFGLSRLGRWRSSASSFGSSGVGGCRPSCSRNGMEKIVVSAGCEPRLSSRASFWRRSSMRFEEIRCRFACRTPRLRRSSIDKSRRRPRYEGTVRGFRSLSSRSLAVVSFVVRFRPASAVAGLHAVEREMKK